MTTTSRANLLSALPICYKPSEEDVICAKGKEAKNHPGNQVFRALIRKHAEEYSSCNRRKERAHIVSSILEHIRRKGGTFVRQHKGMWADIGTRNAREKIGASFRDILHDQYRSSAKAKASFRRQQESLSSESRAPAQPASSQSEETSIDTAGTGSVSDHNSTGGSKLGTSFATGDFLGARAKGLIPLQQESHSSESSGSSQQPPSQTDETSIGATGTGSLPLRKRVLSDSKLGANFRDPLHDQYRYSVRAKASILQEENHISESSGSSQLEPSEPRETGNGTKAGTGSSSDSKRVLSDGYASLEKQALFWRPLRGTF